MVRGCYGKTYFHVQSMWPSLYSGVFSCPPYWSASLSNCLPPRPTVGGDREGFGLRGIGLGVRVLHTRTVSRRGVWTTMGVELRGGGGLKGLLI